MNASFAQRLKIAGYHALPTLFVFFLATLPFLVVLGATSSRASASPVYKWVDRQGITHYSSTPKERDAKIAELPPIMRGELKLPKMNLASCGEHGGVNCQAGTDADGSVICYDGFRDSSQRFLFTCNAPKLEISDISEITDDGAFTVFLRNSRSVEAKNPTVVVKTPSGNPLKLKGPSKIDPFGVAEFLFGPDPSKTFSLKPSVGEVEVSCTNCPG